MCTNGASTAQLESMIEMIDAHVSLEGRWAHRLARTAGDAGFQTTAKKLRNAQELLSDVRAVLDEARDALADGAGPMADIEVKLV